MEKINKYTSLFEPNLIDIIKNQYEHNKQQSLEASAATVSPSSTSRTLLLLQQEHQQPQSQQQHKVSAKMSRFKKKIEIADAGAIVMARGLRETGETVESATTAVAAEVATTVTKITKITFNNIIYSTIDIGYKNLSIYVENFKLFALFNFEDVDNYFKNLYNALNDFYNIIFNIIEEKQQQQQEHYHKEQERQYNSHGCVESCTESCTEYCANVYGDYCAYNDSVDDNINVQDKIVFIFKIENQLKNNIRIQYYLEGVLSSILEKNHMSWKILHISPSYKKKASLKYFNWVYKKVKSKKKFKELVDTNQKFFNYFQIENCLYFLNINITKRNIIHGNCVNTIFKKFDDIIDVILLNTFK